MIDVESTQFNGTQAVAVLPEDDSQSHLAGDQTLFNQVERILRSDELRDSDVLRRLLKFLAEKSASGEANELKEYIIAIDGLGKPPSYDPRHNSAVRIQVGRLRQKLADYYRNEGHEDKVIVDVPKGHFKLKYEIRDSSAPALPQSTMPIESEGADHAGEPSFSTKLMRLRILVAISVGALLALGVGAVYNWLKPAKVAATSISSSSWNADMDDLWRPFIETSRPTIVAIEDPLFVELDGRKGVYFRDKTLNTWQDITSSPAVEALRVALKYREIAPSRYYTAFGEVDASFLIAKILGSRVQNLSVVKSTDLSMRALAENNVVFVGMENIFFTDKIQAAPLEAPLEPVQGGIRNVQPDPGEPSLFVDRFSTAPTEEGIVYALVSHLPGPLGGNDVVSFTSGRSAGYVAAVKAFTDPIFVHDLVRNLKQAGGGQMPHYYQVLLKVKFSAEEPTEINYVLARQLR